MLQSVEACLPDLRDALLANVVCVGGTSLFPNYAARLERSLRGIAPADAPVEVTAAEEPLLAAWRGGSLFAASAEYESQTVTRAQYHEGGHALCRRRFAAGRVTM